MQSFEGDFNFFVTLVYSNKTPFCVKHILLIMNKKQKNSSSKEILTTLT